MVLDSANQIHAAGNMRAAPLVYFRSTTAWDVSTVATSSMVGTNESSATYPAFFNGPTGDIVFAYRDGSSGNGSMIFNTCSAASSKWTRTLHTRDRLLRWETLPSNNGRSRANTPPATKLRPYGFKR